MEHYSIDIIMIEIIREKLLTIAPSKLEIIDESYKHKHHQINLPNTGTHFKINIVAACFEGKNRLACHRLIHKLLDHELQNGIHALSLTCAAS